MPSDRGGSYANPEDPEAVDPQALSSLSIVETASTYQCDSCNVYYAHSGMKIVRETGSRVGHSVLVVLCKWCLADLGIAIMRRHLG